MPKTQEQLDERCQDAPRFLRRMQPVAEYFRSMTSGIGIAGPLGARFGSNDETISWL
jgi:hypothetical protein